jgi:antirestriction protein ArdC
MARITYTADERKARMDAAHAEMVAAVEAISTSDDWRAFLDFARKLHTYSAQNRMWLFQQAMFRGWDDLGHVAGFRTWLSLGRHVRKGERGLSVLAPVRVKVADDDGERYIVRGFKVEHVFASCQTDGDGDMPEPMRPTLLAGEGPEGAWDALTEQVEARGFTIRRAPLFPVNGTTSFASKVVTVADRLDGAAAVKTLAHELAHVKLHADPLLDYHGNRGRCEVEAESVAYLVCRELGLETDAYTFPYVATRAGGAVKVVTAVADRALGCAREIVEQLEHASSELVAA